MQETYRERYEKLKKERKRRWRWSMAILGVVVAAVIVVIVAGALSGSEDPLIDEGEPLVTPVIQDTDPSVTQDAVPRISVSLAEIEDTRLLELVNFRYPLLREPDLDTFATAWPDVPARDTELMLHEEALLAAGSWFSVASKEEIADFYIVSGYRSRERQAEIYSAALNPSFVKPPGHSEHHTGLAMDVGIPGVTFGEMAGRPDVLWLAETAWEHGFILRYTEETYHITRIAFEPWHFRYVGRLHAFYMWENDLVLEQYLDQIRDRGEMTITIEGRTYELWYQTPQAGNIYVPEGLPFTVSADNRGGYIVTVGKE